MNDNERQHFEDLIVKAVQSGKKETSGLVSDILEKVDKSIGVAVEKHINGHLREIKQHLTEQDEKIENSIKATQEVLDTYNQSKGFLTILKKVAMWLIPVAGAWAIISNVWKELTK